MKKIKSVSGQMDLFSVCSDEPVPPPQVPPPSPQPSSRPQYPAPEPASVLKPSEPVLKPAKARPKKPSAAAIIAGIPLKFSRVKLKDRYGRPCTVHAFKIAGCGQIIVTPADDEDEDAGDNNASRNTTELNVDFMFDFVSALLRQKICEEDLIDEAFRCIADSFGPPRGAVGIVAKETSKFDVGFKIVYKGTPSEKDVETSLNYMVARGPGINMSLNAAYRRYDGDDDEYDG